MKTSDSELQQICDLEAGMYRVTNTSPLNIIVVKTANSVATMILRNEHEIVVKEYLDKKETSFKIQFNLNDLSDGNYTFEISNEKKVLTKTITINANQVSIINLISERKSIELQ